MKLSAGLVRERTYHCPLENITEIGAIVFNRNSDALIRLRSFWWFVIVFLIQLSILPHQKDAKRKGHRRSEKHESSTYAHPFNIPWTLRRWIESCTEDWTTLPDDVNYDKPSATASIAALVVYDFQVSDDLPAL